MTTQIGTSVTITRGSSRGQEATTLSAPDDEGNLAVRTAAGKTLVVNVKSLKAPEERTVTEGRVLEVIDNILAGEDLVKAFETDFPGFTEKFQERTTNE